MYLLILILQVIAVAVGFASVVILMFQKNSTATKLMLITCLCSFVQNAGYLLELRSKSLDEAMIAVKTEYLGGAFILTMLSIFTFTYCRVSFYNWIKYALITISTLVLISVWFCEYIPFYYTGVSFVNEGIMPHLHLQKGFLYIVFVVVVYFEFIANSVVAVMSAVRANDPKVKANCILIFFSTVVPCLFYLISITNIIDGYDTAPIGSAVGIGIFSFAIIKRRVFSVVETAHENIMMELEDAIVILDYKRCFQEANKAAIKIFPELSDTPYGQLVPSVIFNSLFDKNPDEDVNINGRFFKVHINEIYNSIDIDRKVIGYTIILFDTTDLKLQLERLEELKIQADSASLAKSSFLANISHEIRTPINVIVGLSDVILRDYDEPQLVGYAQDIQKASRHLLSLINDVLDFSKFEAGHIELVNSEYRVDEFVRDIALVFSHMSEETGIEFVTEISQDIPRVLYGDVIRVRQIITNILNNAFKFTRKGSVRLRAGFEKIDGERCRLVMSVEDTGVGIRQSEMGGLFESFVRLDENINKSVEGTGLGLNITKRLLDEMNGEIKVYSEYGKGSLFIVYIPQGIRCALDDTIGDLKLDKKNKIRSQVDYEAPNAKVLVIDDSKTNLIVAKALLRDTKVKITTGTSGQQCLDLIFKEHFDVIFLDHRMPVMDGIETLHRMKKESHMCNDTPVIMLTANAVNNARDYYMKEGFTDFIGKPINEASITTILKKYLPKELIIES